MALKEDFFCKKKHTTISVSNNINNSHDLLLEDISMVPLRRKVEDFPVKEMPPRKKTKPSSSRKNSVGKIVNQHQALNQKEVKEKEHSQLNLNSKPKGKEKLYKDIIK